MIYSVHIVTSANSDWFCKPLLHPQQHVSFLQYVLTKFLFVLSYFFLKSNPPIVRASDIKQSAVNMVCKEVTRGNCVREYWELLCWHGLGRCQPSVRSYPPLWPQLRRGGAFLAATWLLWSKWCWPKWVGVGGYKTFLLTQYSQNVT